MTIDGIKMGNLGKAMQFTPAKGTTQARIKGMLFSDRGYMRDGVWTESGTDIVNFTAWGSLAEHLNESEIPVGSRLVVVGEWVSSSPENEDGTKRTFWEIKVTDLGVSPKFATVTSTKVVKAAAAPAQNTQGESMIDQLKGLAALHEQGLITDEEFASSKAALLPTSTVVVPETAAVPETEAPKARQSRAKKQEAAEEPV